MGHEPGFWHILADGFVEYDMYKRRPIWENHDRTLINRKIIMPSDIQMALVDH
jgi:hypothetical protein